MKLKKNHMNILIGVGIGAIGMYAVLMFAGKLNSTTTTSARAPAAASYVYPVYPSPSRSFYAPGGTQHGYTTAVINA